MRRLTVVAGIALIALLIIALVRQGDTTVDEYDPIEDYEESTQD
ncbi:hypothetical protein [Natrialba sp. SSL1]|nr:hypothetical protein [Natrialba sp. SSL1]